LERWLRYAEPLTIVLSLLALTSVLFFIQNGDGWTFVLYGIMVFLTLFIFPAIVVFFARLLLVRATPQAVPPLLFPLLFLYSFIPTVTLLLPFITTGLAFSGATEIIFFLFEAMVFTGGLMFFIYFFRKYLLGKLGEKDLTLFLHYFVGGLAYFYFIRLTVLSSLIIQSATEILG
jgi:hypothetical protein